MTGTTRGTRSSRSSFGNLAPANTIPFPSQANMTAVEILAFLPNHIKCADVVYRLVSNGGSRKIFHAIINTFRDLEAEWSLNCCGEAMYKTMNRAGYNNWTIKRHNEWHDNHQQALWNESSLGVGDFRTEQSAPEAGTVSFRSLAANMRSIPEGDDALDLTRMVKYCVENAEDTWNYPNDYEELLESLGGPAQVGDRSTDRTVFGRWERKRAPPPVSRVVEPSPSMESSGERGSSETGSKTAQGRPGGGQRSRSISSGPGTGMKRRATGSRILKEVEQSAHFELGDESDGDDKHHALHTRALAEYVSPPLPVSMAPDLFIVAHLLQVEGFASDSDPASAYAFGGARSTPPYRQLGQIAQPHPWDISSWAENLRWALEQRVLFVREHPAAAGWNESPEHMACIERERTQRVWASDELLDQLLDDE